MRESVEAKGKRYVLEARLRVTFLDRSHIRATCRGSGAVHHLGYDRGSWGCSCPARGTCSHLHALQLVTIAPAEAA
jgi:hypothetical protein